MSVALPLGAVPAHAAADPAALEWDLAAFVNKARADNGKPPIPVLAGMVEQARAWSAEMQAAQRLSHHPDLHAEATRVDPEWRGVAENVGTGTEPASLHDAFMQSAGHRDNILGDWNYLGVGVVVDPGGKLWVTHRFLAAAEDKPTIAQVPTARLAGSDGLSVSQVLYPDAATAGAVLVARDDDFADALAGGPLAARRDGPILLTPSATLPAAVRDEAARALRPGGTVIVLGGPAAVSVEVEEAFRAAGMATERIAGADRYETAVAVAGAVAPSPAEVFLASGTSYPDAIVAGAPAGRLGAPILLTTRDELPAATGAYLDRIRPGRVHAVGGTAVVGDRAYTRARATDRSGGADRYETAVRVAERFSASAGQLTFATGQRWQDALVGSPLAAHHGSPVLLTEDNPSAPVFDYVRARADEVDASVAYGDLAEDALLVLFG